MSDCVSISIVIVNYCRIKDTLDCIYSILQNNKFTNDPKIILIDNGSNDNSFSVFQETYKNDKRIILDRINNNLGFSGGFNRGIQIAISIETTWILLLNNDTLIEKNGINYLINTDFDIVIPKILVFNQPELIWAAGAKWRRFPPGIVIRGYYKKDSSPFNIPQNIKYATGCAIMIKRDALQRLGGFDEDYGSYLEDNDFFYRASQLSLKILYQPLSIIYHKGSSTLGELSKEKWFLLGRNSVLFYLKNNRFSFLSYLTYFIWFMLREIIKGNIRLIPVFFRGVFSGFEYLYSKKRIK